MRESIEARINGYILLIEEQQGLVDAGERRATSSFLRFKLISCMAEATVKGYEEHISNLQDLLEEKDK